MGRFFAGPIFFSCLCTAACMAAEPQEVTLADIEAFVSVEGNYGELLERFLADDPTLSPREFALVYYGFSFTDGYSPFSTQRVLEYMPREWYTDEDLDRCMEVCLGYLGREPVSIGGAFHLYPPARLAGGDCSAAVLPT
ncbi:MAG: DUF4919 domain-containing protein [Rikenellaceae bacterium]|nr:DUF4919 domain-containing protein [Rikenellaceae bacterium]